MSDRTDQWLSEFWAAFEKDVTIQYFDWFEQRMNHFAGTVIYFLDLCDPE